MDKSVPSLLDVLLLYISEVVIVESRKFAEDYKSASRAS